MRMARVSISRAEWVELRVLALRRGTTAQRLLGELIARELRSEEGTAASPDEERATVP